MNILVSSNDRYFMPLAVMLTSLFENATAKNITIYFMHSGLSEQNLDILKKLVEGYGHKLVTIIISKDDILSLKGDKYISEETLFRLLINKYLPKDLHRILWLDCDAIVTKDICGLFNEDLGDCCIGGCIRPEHTQKQAELYFEKFGLQFPHNYINAGIIVMDLDKLREINIEKRIQDCINKYGPDSFQFRDQDLINIIFHGKIKVLDYHKYNLMSNNNYDGCDLKLLLEECSIIHYAGKWKPWMFVDVPFADIWDKYFELSPFSDTKLVRVRKSGLSEMVGRCLKRNGQY